MNGDASYALLEIDRGRSEGGVTRAWHAGPGAIWREERLKARRRVESTETTHPPTIVSPNGLVPEPTFRAE